MTYVVNHMGIGLERTDSGRHPVRRDVDVASSLNSVGQLADERLAGAAGCPASTTASHCGSAIADARFCGRPGRRGDCRVRIEHDRIDGQRSCSQSPDSPPACCWACTVLD